MILDLAPPGAPGLDVRQANGMTARYDAQLPIIRPEPA
jgi:hypothetical protein